MMIENFCGFGPKTYAYTTWKQDYKDHTVVKAKGLSCLRRRDLQEILKLSKTESQRLLEKWIDLGKIKRQGFGRATVYQIRNMKKVSA